MLQRHDGLRLFLRYLVISLVPVVVLGLAVEAYVRHQAERAALAAAEGRAMSVVEGVIEPLLLLGDAGGNGGEGAPLSAEARDALVLSSERLATGGDVARLRLWTTSGRLIVDGNEPDRATERVEIVPELFEAAGNRVATRTGAVREALPAQFRSDAREYLTLFGPIHDATDGTVVAVAELVVPWDHNGYYEARGNLRLVLMTAVALLWVFLTVLTGVITMRLRRSDMAHRHLALVDQLTGLPNRRSFTDQAAAVLDALRVHGEPAAVVMLDLVRFSEINKSVGRAHGDELLRHISLRLHSMVQPGQTVARLGGDVFALLLPGVDGEGAMDLLPVIRRVLDTEVEVAGVPLSFEAAMGVAAFPEHGDDIDTLLQRADIAMESSKRTHVDSQLFGAELDEADPYRLGLAVELRRAIANDELLLMYQPKVHLKDNTVHSVEALLRWRHPERGFVPPSEFVPVAEETALIVPLTAWVLDRAVQQAAAWAFDGLHLRVAVNVSAKNLRDERFPEQVVQTLEKHRLPPQYIELELTETAIIADPERVARTIRRLRDAGLAVALDDFGQGSTSLAHLRNLPLSSLKIDKCFVDDVCVDPMDGAIVYTMIDLGHQLGLEVVAEGVETADQYATLAAWGCDVGQGYFFERPLSAKQISERFGHTWDDAELPAGAVRMG